MNFTYISIPKTGSRSVHRALKDKLFNNHLPISKVEKVGFSFAFFREPSERIESWWTSSRYEYPHQKHLKDIYGNDINEWVYKGCPHHWKWACNPLYQWEFVSVDGVLQIDFIGDFSNMEMQLQQISNNHLKLGKMNLPVLGSSRMEKQSLSEMSIQKLKNMFPKDYELYNIIKKNGCIRK